MSEPVGIEDIKVHLHLDPDDTSDDAYLTSLLLAARRAIEIKTGQTIVADEPSLAGDDLEMAKHAIRLIVGTWFSSREHVASEATTPREIPGTLTWLIEPLMKWDDGE
ncbi:head-tail connector protein [Sphingomonas sp.]|uniref:head-tail connector protein n=1 Tax=Sphingomonas sp. TaxID=28214 RepID=UPI003F6EF2B7